MGLRHRGRDGHLKTIGSHRISRVRQDEWAIVFDIGTWKRWFRKKFIKFSEFRRQVSCIQMILLQRRLSGVPAMRLNNAWIVRTPEN